jgi:hypothetical protein
MRSFVLPFSLPDLYPRTITKDDRPLPTTLALDPDNTMGRLLPSHMLTLLVYVLTTDRTDLR